jgi:general secretion pathway protein E
MAGHQSSQFVDHLRRAGRLRSAWGQEASDEGGADPLPDEGNRELQSDSLRRLWEITDLSAGEFADEAARFHKFSRVSLQEMLSATPLVSAFSQRFLRETLVFPFQSAEHGAILAVADPTDLAAKRAAEIVLGPDLEIRIAAFDDLSVVLDRRLLNDGPAGLPEADGASKLREDDIESLRDLASGAPVVRAVNDLLEKAVELRASDIHIEPFQTALVVRMRIDGLLRSVASPVGVLPQAVISRIKIIASLNIAERRLPQDGAARLRAGRRRRRSSTYSRRLSRTSSTSPRATRSCGNRRRSSSRSTRVAATTTPGSSSRSTSSARVRAFR